MNDWPGVQAPGATWSTIAFVRAGEPVVTVHAEHSKDIVKGLAGRTSLPEGQGMLFDMGANAAHFFWMRGVLIPLDFIFIRDRDGGDGVVMDLVENAQPGDETRRSGVGRFVLEVPGGWVARHGVRAGMRVDLQV
jgi:uncharacterized membrane protein (UPF0127 family)